MKANKELSRAEWQLLINDYISLSRNTGLKCISNNVKKQWEQIIDLHKNYLSQSRDFNELYERIEDLKIKGIGERSLMETASQFAYRYDIPVDDSCWSFFMNNMSVLKSLGTPTRSIKEYFSRLSPDFEKLSNRQKIDFIIKYQNKIRQMLHNR